MLFSFRLPALLLSRPFSGPASKGGQGFSARARGGGGGSAKGLKKFTNLAPGGRPIDPVGGGGAPQEKKHMVVAIGASKMLLVSLTMNDFLLRFGFILYPFRF